MWSLLANSNSIDPSDISSMTPYPCVIKTINEHRSSVNSVMLVDSKSTQKCIYTSVITHKYRTLTLTFAPVLNACSQVTRLARLRIIQCDARKSCCKRWNEDVDMSIIQIYALAAVALASSAAATAGFTFLPSFHRTRGGGARLRRPSRERTRTTAQSTRPNSALDTGRL